jgi:methylated-DNA-[protein]-cysteine S-methyltransferase
MCVIQRWCCLGLTFAELTNTRVGPISFVAGDGGLQRVAFATLEALKSELSMPDDVPSLKGLETVGILLAEVNRYLFGIRTSFSMEIDWDVMDDFQKRVLTLTAEIPCGSVLTYGEVATRLGKPGAARAVGRALAHNPVPVVIPCHRVISSTGELRGYIGGMEKKAILLELEGHQVEGDRVKTSASRK